MFGLFRSWHNERALETDGPWNNLTLVLAYAMEAHLFIKDMGQSPFNVGTRLVLDDFTIEQIAELNERCGSPLKDRTELEYLYQKIGGHPFLARRTLNEMVSKNLEFERIANDLDKDGGILSDHLRRWLVILAKDHDLCEEVRGILRGEPCKTPESFYRLRSAGLVIGNSQSDTRLRCEIYKTYLARHLL